MKVIGITGPTGAGKTTALHVLKELGVQIIDADVLYHRLLQEDRELREALVEAFGEGVLDESGRIARKKLAAAVYPDRLEQLNAVTHPAVVAAVGRELEAFDRMGCFAAAIDAIALVECGLGARCDAVVSILAPAEVRIRRIMARDGIDEAYARRRVLAQQPDEFFRAHSGYVLENLESDTPESFGARARALFEGILGAKNKSLPGL